MTAAPDVSVVFATRDRPRRLAALLESLRAQTLSSARFEVVVGDDGSGPETREVLARQAARGGLNLRVLRRERAAGPAAARNDGWRAARAPTIAFTDDDCVVAPNWLEAGLRAIDENPGAIVQGPVAPIPEEAGRLTPFTHTFSNDRCGPWYETANIFYPRTVLERLGGFDAQAFIRPGGEDTDLAWRAIERGTPTALAPDASAYHAVMALGPLGTLRRAARWSDTVLLFARHPGLRDHLTHRVFWSKRHLHLVRALAGLLLPRRLWPLAAWLAAPYASYLVRRRSGPLLAPLLVAVDLVELVTVVRGAVRHRTLVI